MCGVSLAEMNPPPIFNCRYSRFLWCVYIHPRQQATINTKFQDERVFCAPFHYFAWAGVHLFIRWCRSEGEAFFVPWLNFLPPPSATIRYRLLLLRLLLLLPRLLLLLILIALLLLLLLANTATSTTATFFASTSTSSSTCFFLTFLRDRNLKRGDLANGGWEGKDPNISMHFAHLNECQRSQYCTVPIVHLYHTSSDWFSSSNFSIIQYIYIYFFLASLPSTKSSHIVHEAAGQWMKGLHCTLDGGVMMAEQIKATLSDRTRTTMAIPIASNDQFQGWIPLSSKERYTKISRMFDFKNGSRLLP